jgi:hypothetical protein
VSHNMVKLIGAASSTRKRQQPGSGAQAEAPKPKTRKVGVLEIEEDSDDEAPEEFTAVAGKQAAAAVREAEKRARAAAPPTKPKRKARDRVRDKSAKDADAAATADEEYGDDALPADVLAAVRAQVKAKRKAALEEAYTQEIDKNESREAKRRREEANQYKQPRKDNFKLVVLRNEAAPDDKRRVSTAARKFLTKRMKSQKRMPYEAFAAKKKSITQPSAALFKKKR